jgi:hypothetical protein
VIILNIKEIVLKYIDNYNDNEPIFMNDIKEYVLQNIDDIVDIKQVYNNINVIIYRLLKENKLKSKYRGVYFKPKKTLFGESTISNKDLIEKKFLVDKEGNIKGYIVGAKLYNMIGLTTQVPNITDIVTNECKYHTIFYDNLRVNIYKPKITIDDENYLYLQLLDIIENKDNINIETDNFDEIIFNIIDNNKLGFEKLIKYARITNNKKAIDMLVSIAR